VRMVGNEARHLELLLQLSSNFNCLLCASHCNFRNCVWVSGLV
jgi:hypothetical protein